MKLVRLFLYFFTHVLLYFIHNLNTRQTKENKRRAQTSRKSVDILPVYTDRCDQISARQHKHECSLLSKVAATIRSGVNERFVYITKQRRAKDAYGVYKSSFVVI